MTCETGGSGANRCSILQPPEIETLSPHSGLATLQVSPSPSKLCTAAQSLAPSPGKSSCQEFSHVSCCSCNLIRHRAVDAACRAVALGQRLEHDPSLIARNIHARLTRRTTSNGKHKLWERQAGKPRVERPNDFPGSALVLVPTNDNQDG